MVFILGVEHLTSSTPLIVLGGSLRLRGSLPNHSTCVLWILRRFSTASFTESYRGLSGIIWCPLLVTGIIVWSTSPAVSRTGSRWGLDPTRAALNHRLFLDKIFFRVFLGTAMELFSDFRFGSLLFADDVALLGPSVRGLQLDRFTAQCEMAGMKISTSKSEAMVLGQKKVKCLLWVVEDLLPHVEEFKYLGDLFTSEGKMERQINRHIGATFTVMRTRHRFVVVKRKLNPRAKLLIYRSIFIPNLTYIMNFW